RSARGGSGAGGASGRPESPAAASRDDRAPPWPPLAAFVWHRAGLSYRERVSETYDLYQQGRAHLRKGRAAQATVALEKAKRREPDKASIREALVIAYLRIQRYEEAEEEFRAMLELSPADHYAHYALGRALEKLGRDTEANGHYKLASSLRPQNEHYASRILDLDREDEPEDGPANGS